MEKFPKISLEEMKRAIQSSGYLLEQRVEKVLRDSGFITSTNHVYKDLETDKVRETDISATIGIQGKQEDSISAEIICECENNKQPIVFFESEYTYTDYTFHIPTLSLPSNFVELLINVGDPEIEDPTFSGVYATQYCSFHMPKQGKSDWLALHLDEQHQTFNSIVKSIKHWKHRSISYQMQNLKTIELIRKKAPRHLTGILFYPLVVLQGDLFVARTVDDNITLEPIDHIKFVKNDIEGTDSNSYFIDVITERALPSYIAYLKAETDIISNHISTNREVLLEQDEKDFKKLSNGFSSNFLYV